MSDSLRSRLEAEWHRRGVRLPNHFVWWKRSGFGWISEETGLVYAQGKRVKFPERLNPMRKKRIRKKRKRKDG